MRRAAGRRRAPARGAPSSCILARDPASGACIATCDVVQPPILKTINLFQGIIKDTTNQTCFNLSVNPFLPPGTVVTTCDTQQGYLAKYVENGERWSGATFTDVFLVDGIWLSTLNPPPLFYPDVIIPCAIIPFSAPCYLDAVDNCRVDVSQCTAVGALGDDIYVDEIPYVSMTTAADVVFPPESEFPATPPF